MPALADLPDHQTEVKSVSKPLPQPDFTARLEAPELLDLGVGNEMDVFNNLAEIARMNRYLGGVQAITCHLYPLLSTHSQPASILDLGTGSGDLLTIITNWAEQNHRSVQVIGLDWAKRNLAAAQKRGALRHSISLLQADARCLPLLEGGVDYILSSLFLHHFRPEDVIELLRLAYTKARCGLLMSDIVRGRIPYLAFKLIQPFFARHPITRHDGALSIRRAYVPAELSALAQAAGIPGFQIFTHWPWRMTLVAIKGRVA